MTDEGPLLSVRNLKKHYPITKGVLSKEVGRVRAVDGVSFDLARCETLGLVGESGCGKSTAATSIIRLEEPTDGEVLFDSVNEQFASSGGRDVTEFDSDRLKRFRRQAQIIFQDPSSSFDPRMTIGESVGEPLRVHGISKQRRQPIVRDLLEQVGLTGDDYYRYPHEFSGGQKQRVALARALVLNPELVVADEPVSALDVSIQAEILGLVNDIQEKFGLSILFISHDMRVIREVADRVAVMYLGKIAEIGPTEEIFRDPQHPYTRALLSSIPEPDPRKRGTGIELSGDVPSPSDPPSGCRFHTRCPEVIQSDAYDLDQEHWRAVLDFRNRVRNRDIDLEAASEFSEGEPGADLETVLREEFGIPEQLPDPRAEAVVSDGVEHVANDDVDRAAELLTEEFQTMCDQSEPELIETGERHRVACHLLEDSVDAESRQAPSIND